MHKDKVKEFDITFNQNYQEIMKSARTLCKSYSNDTVTDTVHNTYIKIRNKIERDGFKGKNYMGYIWISIKNEYGMELRKDIRDKTIYINDMHYDKIDYKNIVEKILIEQDELSKSSQQYDHDLLEITEKLFKFVDRNFEDKEAYLFKNYYLIPKSTYRKLSKRTGYTITDCSNIMKMMKKEIRINFIDWYKKNYNG